MARIASVGFLDYCIFCGDRRGGTRRRSRVAPVEEHFSVPQVAERLNLSDDTVRKLFAEEPGVIKLGSPETRNKRRYFSLRIPHRVLHRVMTRMRGLETHQVSRTPRRKV